MNKLEDNSSVVIRGIISLGLSNFLGLFFSLITITVVARILPPEIFGVYSLMIAIVGLLEVFGNFGVRLSAAKFVASASSPSEQQIIVNNLLTFRLISAVAISLLSILGKPLFLRLFPSQLLSQLYFFVPVLFSVQTIESTLAYVMQGFKQYKLMAIVQFLSSIFNAGFVLIFLLVFRLGITGFVLATIISFTITALVRYRLIPTSKAFALDPKLMKKILYFGLPLQGNDLLSFAFQKLDVLMLGALIGPSSIAYLDIASKVPNYFKNFNQALQSVYFPHMSGLFASKQDDQAVNVLNNFLRITSFFTMFSALVFILFQHQLIGFLFSEKYLPSATAAGILMVASGIGIMSQFLDTSLISTGKPAYLLIINSVTAIISVFSNLTLIPLLGFVGVAYAKLLANCMSLPVSGVCLLREKIRFSIRDALLPVLFLITCLGIYYGFNFDNFVMKSLLIFLFCLASFVFSVITKSDIGNLLVALNAMRLRLAPKI
jgi:O-antigen/teichoic acid export membrane protein